MDILSISETFYGISPRLLFGIPIIQWVKRQFQWLVENHLSTGIRKKKNQKIFLFPFQFLIKHPGLTNRTGLEFLFSPTKSTSIALWECQGIIKSSEFKNNTFHKASGCSCTLHYTFVYIKYSRSIFPSSRHYKTIIILVSNSNLGSARL